jgi:hypothetical protein
MTGGDHHPALTVQVPQGKVKDRCWANSHVHDIHSRTEQALDEQIPEPFGTVTAIPPDYHPTFPLAGHIGRKAFSQQRHIPLLDFLAHYTANVVFPVNIVIHAHSTFTNN